METETGCSFGLDNARAAFERAGKTALDGMKELAEVCPSMSSMGSTIVIAWFVNGNLYYGHAGDSRLYLLRAGSLLRLTDDHSLFEALRRASVVSEPDRRTNVWRHVITRYIGPRSK